MQRFVITLSIIIFHAVIVSGTINPGSDEPGSMKIKKTSDFDISGDGIADQWNKAEWVNIPVRTDNTVNYITRVRVMWSDTGIYFNFYCEDEKITATMEEDNLNLWEEDVVEVFLMPDDNYPLYFEYQLSPLNYELTLLIPNLDGNFLGWLPWKYDSDRKTRRKTKVIYGDDGSGVTGWSAEFFIPWKLLAPLISGPPEPGTRWKANMYRLDYDKGPTRFTWQKTDRHFHEPHNFGTFIFE